MHLATDHRVNRAYVYLVDAGERWKAATLQTQAESLSEFPEAAGPRRKQGKVHGRISCDLRTELGLMLNVPLPTAL